MDMRTPLGKVRGLGSAKEGTQHFWRQRLTAVANVPLVIFLVWLAVSLVGAPHGEVVEALSSPFASVLLLASILSITFHMKLGMQVVIEDYIHGEGTRFLLLVLNIFFCSAIALASVFAVLKLGFGG